jgi:hypothetical protein
MKARKDGAAMPGPAESSERARVRSRLQPRVGAGSVVWTMRAPAAQRDPDWFTQDGPRSDHLAALIRRQRRRRALRRLFGRRPSLLRRTYPSIGPARGPVLGPPLTALPRPRSAAHDEAGAATAASTRVGAEPEAEAQWGWLSDGDVRRILTSQDPERARSLEVLDVGRQSQETG